MSVTKRAGSAGPLIVLCAVLALTPVAVDSPLAQRPEPVAHGVFDGDTMFTVLPPNASRPLQVRSLCRARKLLPKWSLQSRSWESLWGVRRRRIPCGILILMRS